MEYLTAEELKEATNSFLCLGRYFCPDCLHPLQRIPHTKKYYCSNDMCYNEDQGKIDKGIK